MRKVAFLSLLVGAATAAPSPRANHVLHEKRAFEPEEWVQSGRLDPGQILPLRIGLAQSNLDQLEDMLMAVSHPTSPDYGKHLTLEQVIDTFAPSRSSVDTVKDWLTSFGFSEDRIKLSPSKVWMDVVNATASEVEDLLNTEYHVYTHSETGLEQISCHSYYVPNHVKDHIELIKPTVHFKRTLSGTAKPRHKRQAGKKPLVHSHLRGPMPLGSDVTITPALENCDETITVACLQALYSVNYTPVATDRNTYGIVEFTPVAFLQGDLDLFFGNFSPNLVGVSPNLVSIDGGVDQTQQQGFDDNGEADLDLEYAMALTNPQPITLLQTGDLVEGASFDNWLDAVDGSFCTFEGGDNPEFDGIYPDPAPGGFKGPESCGILAPPNVVSVSFGSDEADVTLAYATRQCNEYGKLGLMGSSVLYSSGDDGVAGNGDLCLNARNRPVRNGTKFNPGFPVTCPFVTAVGATQIDPGNTVNDPEGACEQVIFSGGGFSNFFAMPSYQADAVTNFLTNHPPPFTSAQFNNSGNVRAFPDLSANGANYVIGVDGEFELVFGTSCSSPVVGSFLTLINDARIAAGKGPVGFINPTIYSAEFASAFNDITHGGNQGCGTPGFTATTGWDPVTGVGTPNVTRLMELWLALP
ncbi:subtilisin-like protein [Fomitiporia mediterranea MF3/22]|uniref:subtilisin-like protein n=1 Tax=Fomitiporia mediterranea (strain MF3/22) TaxID=694068 RepID=UPI000440882C|nr:subtilisin-like protein [Fomitiporia mediterranea MF3/22]EJC98371.1 subtilisin-like protein [Fomitiporia mediterranea MF3/22]